MTISSSLNAGVAGLNVNASRLATIADNIANSGTYGYKREVADFQSMVISQGQGSYSAGGVRVTTGRMIDQRGTLITTDNPTDLAIGGRGMLPVTSITALDQGDTPTMLTTTGSFRPDAEGFLRTDSGLVLMGWPADADGVIAGFPRDSFEGLEPIQINSNQFSGDPTTRMQLSVNLPATATEAGASGDPLNMTAEYYDNLGTSKSIEISFTPTVPASGTSHEWTMTIRDSATGATPIGEYTLTFDDTRGNGGNLLSATLVTGAAGGAYDPANGTLSVDVVGGPIELSIGGIGDPSGLTQLSDTFARAPVVKNGSPVGNLDSVEVDADGHVNAIYNSGFTRTIYQIPLVDVPNPNKLISLNSQAYQVSPESGPFFLWDAGDGPTGDVIGFSREESATDVAGELTQLIQTQRAYSSNAKVIQTVDEMLQETTNIKR
ncbi:MAG: flagellar hook-basal body complex protein [Roseicyclus sp.]|uniref:flagellar hook protein FlgE n=1 Tax=Boseongicola sp. H5 TaxID=2763261 RepID=UPI001B2BD388|nr:flagellar hook-basal body complex protein [Boseongicola sp. H5]MBO6603351.1 flagellar hook-basal body complex protein [Roseicyclus sp.]MBO6626256.1 flagellar hook-basal body complex protein [Roseicyclus sp.]MBO6923576.1 flagellar hook-basal body complex protein [Roseicyclus sp.]